MGEGQTSTVGVWYKGRRGKEWQVRKWITNMNWGEEEEEEVKKERRERGEGDEAVSEGAKETEGKGGARLLWSAASRLCGPCVPAWRKQARQGRVHTHTHTEVHTQRTTHTNSLKAKHLLNTKTHYTHTLV